MSFINSIYSTKNCIVLHRRWRKPVLQKRTRLHYVTTQKTIFRIVAITRTTNLT